MAQLNKPAFEALYGSSGTKFPTNTTGAIRAIEVREFGRDIADSLDFRRFRGNYDASTNVFPSTGGNHTAGAPGIGDFWQTTEDGTLDGVFIPKGTWLWSRQNGPTSDFDTTTGWKAI